jgi:hypothetical protein
MGEENSFCRVSRGWGEEGEMTQALYEHMNNKTIKIKKKKKWERGKVEKKAFISLGAPHITEFWIALGLRLSFLIN